MKEREVLEKLQKLLAKHRFQIFGSVYNGAGFASLRLRNGDIVAFTEEIDSESVEKRINTLKELGL